MISSYFIHKIPRIPSPSPKTTLCTTITTPEQAFSPPPNPHRLLPGSGFGATGPRILSDRATRRQYDRARFDEARAKSQARAKTVTRRGEFLRVWWELLGCGDSDDRGK